MLYHMYYRDHGALQPSVLNELAQRINGLNGGVGLGWLGSYVVG